MATRRRLFALSALCFVSQARDLYDIDDNVLHKITFGSDWTSEAAEAAEKLPDTVKMSTKHNEMYVCSLPKSEREDTGYSSDRAKETPLELLKPLLESGTCTYRLEHYWNYELCHGKHLRQFHDDPVGTEGKPTEYFLGKYNMEQLVHAVAAQKAEASEGKVKKPPKKMIETIQMPYYEMLLTDGTLCDLNGLPRQTRVQYFCYPGSKNEMISFKETSTCYYEVMVFTPLLCRHPDYKPDAGKEIGVHCEPSNMNALGKPRDLARRELEDLKMRTGREMFEGHFTPGKVPGSVKITIKPVSPHGTSEEEIEDDSEEEEEGPVSPPPKGGSRKEKDFKQLTDPEVAREFLQGKHCLYGGTGWWKYEFCYGKTVRQYHQEKGRRVTEITLGNFRLEEHKRWLGENPAKAPKRIELRKSVSHFYSDGDYCDEVERPRQIEVRLKCLKFGSLSSVSIFLLEPETCRYILGVESPLICDILPLVDEYGLVDLSSFDFKSQEAKEEESTVQTTTPPLDPAMSKVVKEELASLLPDETALQKFIMLLKSHEFAVIMKVKIMKDAKHDGAGTTLMEQWLGGVRSEYEDLLDLAEGDLQKVLTDYAALTKERQNRIEEELALDYEDDDMDGIDWKTV